MKYKLLYRLKHMSFSTKAICLDLNIISDIWHFIALRGSFVQLDRFKIVLIALTIRNDNIINEIGATCHISLCEYVYNTI
jgi:hypothetical protein